MNTSSNPFLLPLVGLSLFTLLFGSPSFHQEDSPGIIVPLQEELISARPRIFTSGIEFEGAHDTNEDNEAGILISPTSGLVTDESGKQASFTVQLNTQPVNDVTISLNSNKSAEGIVSSHTLTFTSSDWYLPQTIIITGQDDSCVDGDQPYLITTSPASSDDDKYKGMDAEDVRVTNEDLDEAGLLSLTPPSGLFTNEGGGTATFQVILKAQPTTVVTATLSSSDESQGVVSPHRLSFSPPEWDRPQTVIITGMDDTIEDDDVHYNILLHPLESTDSNFQGIDPPDVDVINIDNDSAGIAIQPTSGLVTREAGGNERFTVVLNTKPLADVTLPISSTNRLEGQAFPTALRFTPENWNDPQPVTVMGSDDILDDGDIPYTIVTGPAASQDSKYQSKKPADVQVINQDNEEPPVAEDDSYVGGQGTRLNKTVDEGLLVNDRDENGDSLNVLKLSDPFAGVLNLNANGSFSYNPPTDTFTGTVTFTYQSLDSLKLKSNIATVRIVIDDRPVVNWLDPVETGGIYYLDDWNNEAILEVEAQDNKSVDRVVFKRWDTKKMDYIVLSIDREVPYKFKISAEEIQIGWNQFFAEAYDNEDHISKRQHVWLFREKMTFLPGILQFR